jgi:Kyakuja-Dileera-Zisupton transposase
MDYILLSAIAGFDLKELTLSYDIACQWKKNFGERMERLPEHLRLDLERFELETGLPVWHALAHEDVCASVNSLNYIPGVGRSDGEGVERLWAFLNGFAYQSKEMGLGNRADTIEDKLDSHNFLKNLRQRE